MQLNVQPYTEGMKLDGFISGMPNEAYHAAPGISKSGLDKIARSPAHYKFAPLKDVSRHFVIGRAVHAAILEPELFIKDYVLLRDVTDRRSSAYREAIKNHPEEYVLTGKEADYVVGMQESVHSVERVKKLIDDIQYTELSLFVTDTQGTLMKCRFDAITKSGLILDLKSTQDARVREFSRSIFNYRYHVQDAFYSDLFTAATSHRAEFIFIAVESEPPHATVPYVLDDISREIGQSDYHKDLIRYAECEKTNDWPAYEQTADRELIALPEWAIADYEEETDKDRIII